MSEQISEDQTVFVVGSGSQTTNKAVHLYRHCPQLEPANSVQHKTLSVIPDPNYCRRCWTVEQSETDEADWSYQRALRRGGT